MAWNEPGGGKKDPWGGGGSNQGPPDLDEVVRKLQEKMGGLFGGQRRSGGGGAGPSVGSLGIGLILLVALVIWGLTGIYIVDEGKRGVVLRFGRYVDATLPGPHWHIPYPIESVEVVDVEQQRYVEVGYRRSDGRSQAQGSVPREALMLTEDENIVDVQLAVQYQVKNARDYLFNVRDPDLTLKQATESAVREVVGDIKMDFALTEGRSEVVLRTKTLLQQILDLYQSGLQVTSVNMQKARPPQEVKAAFDDAVKAREDEQRLKNEAEAYSREVIPVARGAAARTLEEGNAYKARVIAQAQGDVSRFSQLLKEYEKAPAVTRQRLYIDSLESVLRKASKVVVDVKGGNNLLYLPLDRLMQRADTSTGTRSSATSVPVPLTQEEDLIRQRDSARGRRTR